MDPWRMLPALLCALLGEVGPCGLALAKQAAAAEGSCPSGSSDASCSFPAPGVSKKAKDFWAEMKRRGLQLKLKRKLVEEKPFAGLPARNRTAMVVSDDVFYSRAIIKIPRHALLSAETASDLRGLRKELQEFLFEGDRLNKLLNVTGEESSHLLSLAYPLIAEQRDPDSVFREWLDVARSEQLFALQLTHRQRQILSGTTVDGAYEEMVRNRDLILHTAGNLTFFRADKPVTVDEASWALAVIMRHARLVHPHQDVRETRDPRMYLFPLVELLDVELHPDPGVAITFQEEILMDGKKEEEMVLQIARRDMPKGEEIFLWPGRLSNSEMVARHGQSFRSNPVGLGRNVTQPPSWSENKAPPALLSVLVALALPWTSAQPAGAADCKIQMTSIATACPGMFTQPALQVAGLIALVCDDTTCNEAVVAVNSSCSGQQEAASFSQMLGFCNPCMRSFLAVSSTCNTSNNGPTYEGVCVVDTECYKALKVTETNCQNTAPMGEFDLKKEVNQMWQMCDSGKCAFSVQAVGADERCIAGQGPKLEAACTTACNPLFCTFVEDCNGQVDDLPAFMNRSSTEVSGVRSMMITALEPCACGSGAELTPSPERCQDSEKSCSKNNYDETGSVIGTDIVCVEMGANCPCDAEFEDQCFGSGPGASGNPSGDPSYGSSGMSSGDPSYGASGMSSGDPSYGASGMSSGDASYGASGTSSGDPSYGSSGMSSGDPSYGSSGMSSGDPSYGSSGTSSVDPSYGASGTSSGDASYGRRGQGLPPTYGASGMSSGNASYGASGTSSGDASYGASGMSSGDPSYGASGMSSGDPSYMPPPPYPSGGPSYGSSGMSSSSYCQAKSSASYCTTHTTYPPMFSICETGQMECYPTTYDTSGNPVYRRLQSESQPTCVDYDKDAGCPCDKDWEHKCNDSMGSWCQPKTYGDCPITCGMNQTSCYATTYDAEGNANYTAPGQQSCANISEGCPCNAKWEEKCSGPYGSWCQDKQWGKCPILCAEGETLCYETLYDSSGYPDYMAEGNQTCADKNAGCPCNSKHENKCTDSWGSWCTAKMYGDCPITCKETEQVCFVTVYDSITGEANYSAPSTQVCADMTAGCPCIAEFENKCEMDGYSWCQSKKWQCPITCKDTETTCYAMAYSQDGYPDYDVAGNQSCAPLDVGCPCDSQFEDNCSGLYGSYCQAKVYGSCPLSCAQDEYLCYDTVYTDLGEPDWYAEGNQSCANMTSGCPCNAQWEQKCTDSYGSWCQSTSYSCPLDCGTDSICYGANGNMSCPTASGCVCDDATEHSCPDPYMPGRNQCLSKTWYSACPLTCQAGESLCYSSGFDDTGAPTWTDVCSVVSDWMCPVLCAAGASKCGQGDMSYCIQSSQSCPVECKDTEQSCWVDSYDAQGQYSSGVDQCVPLTQKCPCGSGAINCTSDGMSYCLPATMTCPVVCKEGTEKTCVVMSYTASGSWDDAATKMQCVANAQSCSCGTNAKLCKFTDENGLSEDYCLPSKVDGIEMTCPVMCKSDEQTCYQVDYNTTGYTLGFKQTCAAASASCPCGKETLKCKDGMTGDSYCMPNYDLWLKQPTVCPVACDYMVEEMCSVPSFDSLGEVVSVKDTCIPKDGKCDCKLGTNAQSCNRSTVWGEWTECIPRVGGYCPVTCKSGEVSCPMLEDYLPNGTWKASRAPSVSCAANSTACSCGLEAKQCVMGDIVWCQPKTMQCPVTCSTAEPQKCYITDYSDAGDVVSEREQCVDEKATCPCGKNAAKCPGTEICLTAVGRTAVCPCAANEDFCWVKDYTSDGTVAGEFPKCTPKDTACECGKNTIKCADPRDATQFACVPKSSKDGKGGSCPKPCTPKQELAGNKTCIQTNLDPKGNFVSQTTTCGVAGSCQAGTNMKNCPSGAVISAGEQCVDLYGLGNKNGSAAAAVNGSTVQKATLTFTLTGVGGSGTAAKAGNANVAVTSALQLPATLKSSLSVMVGTSSGSGRRLAAGSAIVVMEVENQGATGVSPQQAADQLKKMVQSGDTKLSKAMSDLGSVDAEAGVSVTSATKTVETRAAAAVSLKAAKDAAQEANVMTTIVPTVRTTRKPTAAISDASGLSTTQVPSTTPAAVPSTTPAAVPSTTPAAAKPSVLQGKMAITVPSCAAFVANVNATSSVKAGLAAAANAPVAYIDVKLACNARRLSQTRRLADETVNADYTITIPATDQTVVASSVIALLGGSVSAGIAQTISQQTGITVTVSVTKPVVVEDNQTPTTVSQTPGTSSDVHARSTSSARPVYNCLPYAANRCVCVWICVCNPPSTLLSLLSSSCAIGSGDTTLLSEDTQTSVVFFEHFGYGVALCILLLLPFDLLVVLTF
ncbi:unnamed protein product [Polarella glacialis]|uniref:Uncharacterized protein n=1 Tax=Polarella glacialis TaxID=89957 RepID=A0A813E9Q9_POLGL|nr:unnamed protein product [Polarella glacialis]